MRCACCPTWRCSRRAIEGICTGYARASYLIRPQLSLSVRHPTDIAVVKEIVLQHFFEGHATSEELAADAIGAFDRQTDSGGTVFSRLNAVPMNHEFPVTAQHIIKLIDA